MLGQQIEYIDVEVTLPPPVNKQVWDDATQTFVPMTLYRKKHVLSNEEHGWLCETYGRPGVYKKDRYWNTTNSGSFIVMDEKVYTWFQMKWGNK
jgi:hypothetical protein